MSITQLKIGHRLALGFGVVLALIAVMTAIAWYGLVGAQRGVDQIQVLTQRVSTVDEWVASTRLNINRVLGVAKSNAHPQVDAYFKPLVAETTARISELQAVLEQGIQSTEGKAMLDDIAARRAAYIAMRKNYFESLRLGDMDASERLLNSGLMPAVDGYIGAMTALQTLLRTETERAVADLKAAGARQIALLLALAAAAVVFGLVVAWRITRSVTVPVGEALAVARTVASGDLTQRVDSRRKDELGDLLNALDAMQQALVQTVSQVRGATESINTASQEIASGNQDLSARTEQTASNLEETAASMEELTSTVRNSADAARQANQLATSAAEIAARGGQVVDQVVSTMDEINQSSQKISDIIGVIDGIAFQTNILALNAAVEAARAGEQGRGFAVVAGEVRNLAQRSAEAAKEIKQLIGASVDKAGEGARLVADAGQTMSEIVGSVQRVSDIIGEITAAAGEQSEGIGQVNVAVNQLDQMTQQNAALVEQSAAAAESLKEQAQRLAQVVKVFRVDGHAAVAVEP